MLLTYLQPFLCFALGVSCVFAGLAFINGQLLPEVLSPIYGAISNVWWRTLLASGTIFLGANYFNAKGYILGGQALGGPLYVVCFVVGMVLSAVLIEKLSLNMHIIVGTLVLCCGALWVVYGLGLGRG